MLNAIKELKAENDALAKQNEVMRQEMEGCKSDMTARLEWMEAMMKRMSDNSFERMR